MLANADGDYTDNITPVPELEDDEKFQKYIQDRRVIGVSGCNFSGEWCSFDGDCGCAALLVAPKKDLTCGWLCCDDHWSGDVLKGFGHDGPGRCHSCASTRGPPANSQVRQRIDGLTDLSSKCGGSCYIPAGSAVLPILLRINDSLPRVVRPSSTTSPPPSRNPRDSSSTSYHRVRTSRRCERSRRARRQDSRDYWSMFNTLACAGTRVRQPFEVQDPGLAKPAHNYAGLLVSIYFTIRA